MQRLGRGASSEDSGRNAFTGWVLEQVRNLNKTITGTVYQEENMLNVFMFAHFWEPKCALNPPALQG